MINPFISNESTFSFVLEKRKGDDAHLESILALECPMIILDRIETIIQVCSLREKIFLENFEGKFRLFKRSDYHQSLLSGLLKILLHAFALNQRTWT